MGSGGSVPSAGNEVACQVHDTLMRRYDLHCDCIDENVFSCRQSQDNGIITTGGGFSTYYSRPSWQSDAVTSYFAGLSTSPAAGYNVNGRGYPDVSLVAVKYQVVIAGSLSNIYGTSASAPVFAAYSKLQIFCVR
jgi:hypothetical protein